jgi:hypothetical protein
MTSIADGSVNIQTTSESNPSTPAWFGEVVLITRYLCKHGVLTKISERVRFARRRFGHYEVLDFLAVLFGYAISGEPTLEAFYERLQPFAVPFMALFERDRLPARSTLSRFLAALTPESVEALRTLFLDDGLSRPLFSPDKQTGGLVDRTGNAWVVFDIDGTREAARQRALPQTEDLPPAFRRLDEVCAPSYTGRKRGQVVRTRTVVSQAHSFQWLGSFGNRGNGRYRTELCQGLSALGRYLTAQQRALLRLDGQYGTGAVLSDLAGFTFVTRGKDYTVLDHPLVQARLHLPPDQFQSRPESQMVRSLYDCPQVPVGPEGVPCRVVVATHPAGKKKSPVGVTRAGVVYELFFTNVSQRAFTASDVVELYLHRGAFEPLLSDEDQEIDPDRWCSHTASGQEAWCVVSQWVWNLRLELGHHLKLQPVRTTEFAPAIPEHREQAAVSSVPAAGYGPPTTATSWKTGRFTGADFPLQPDGTLRCPAGQPLHPQEWRREADGSLRVVYAASIRSCRPCPLREQCQWNGGATAKPRQVSVLLHPLGVGEEPLLWRDWSRRAHRRACMQLVRHQRLEMDLSPPTAASLPTAEVILSRAQRAHSRLSWEERLARNARPLTAGHVTIKLFGIPAPFAASLGLATA